MVAYHDRQLGANWDCEDGNKFTGLAFQAEPMFEICGDAAQINGTLDYFPLSSLANLGQVNPWYTGSFGNAFDNSSVHVLVRALSRNEQQWVYLSPSANDAPWPGAGLWDRNVSEIGLMGFVGKIIRVKHFRLGFGSGSGFCIRRRLAEALEAYEGGLFTWHNDQTGTGASTYWGDEANFVGGNVINLAAADDAIANGGPNNLVYVRPSINSSSSNGPKLYTWTAVIEALNSLKDTSGTHLFNFTPGVTTATDVYSALDAFDSGNNTHPCADNKRILQVVTHCCDNGTGNLSTSGCF